MIWLLSFRLLNSLLVRSYFSPDEYWQSLEVAHKIVFGYGELTWEWENSALRSIIHPGIFASLYYFLKVFFIDYPEIVAYSPRVLQGVMLYITEVCIFRVSGNKGLVLSVSSWFLWYAAVRTYSNSAELMMNSIGLYLLSINSLKLFNFVIGINCMIRPTAVIIWIPVYFVSFYTKGLKFIVNTTITA
jgi:Alg9-like mannosyltransferase family.